MIQSNLLYLTPITNDDADIFTEIYTDPNIMEHIGPALNKESAMKLFNKCLSQLANEKPKYLFYVITGKQNNNKYGIIGLLWNQPENNSVELGVMISKAYISKGYAYKATELLMQFVFNELRLYSIVVICNESNTAANRTAQALGFIFNGIMKDKKSNQRKIKWESKGIYIK